MCLAMQFTPAVEILLTPRKLSLSSAKDWKMRLIYGSIAYRFSTNRFVEAVSPINGNPRYFFKITISSLKGIVTWKTPHGINPSDATPSSTLALSHRIHEPSNHCTKLWLALLDYRQCQGNNLTWFGDFRIFEFSAFRSWVFVRQRDHPCLVDTAYLCLSCNFPFWSGRFHYPNHFEALAG